MKEDSIIKYLYDHFDETNFGFRPDTRAYRDDCRTRDNALEKLRQALSKDEIDLLEKYIDEESHVVYLEEKEIYKQGVCLGVKFVAEAFVTNKNQIDI